MICLKEPETPFISSFSAQAKQKETEKFIRERERLNLSVHDFDFILSLATWLIYLFFIQTLLLKFVWTMTRHFYVYQIESIYFDMPISIALKAGNNFLFLETLKYL